MCIWPLISSPEKERRYVGGPCPPNEGPLRAWRRAPCPMSRAFLHCVCGKFAGSVRKVRGPRFGKVSSDGAFEKCAGRARKVRGECAGSVSGRPRFVWGGGIETLPRPPLPTSPPLPPFRPGLSAAFKTTGEGADAVQTYSPRRCQGASGVGICSGGTGLSSFRSHPHSFIHLPGHV